MKSIEANKVFRWEAWNTFYVPGKQEAIPSVLPVWWQECPCRDVFHPSSPLHSGPVPCNSRYRVRSSSDGTVTLSLGLKPWATQRICTVPYTLQGCMAQMVRMSWSWQIGHRFSQMKRSSKHCGIGTTWYTEFMRSAPLHPHRK